MHTDSDEELKAVRHKMHTDSDEELKAVRHIFECMDKEFFSKIQEPPNPPKIQFMFDVTQFRPDEIDIRIVDNFIIIHGKHEELADGHGFVSREFTRRCQLPDGVKPEKVKSYFRKDGILTIEAPNEVQKPLTLKEERFVPVTCQKSVTSAEFFKFIEENKFY